MSRTNIELDDRLVKEAMSAAHYRTKKELVHTALTELVKRLKRKAILGLSGSACWQGDLEKSRRSKF